MVREERAAAFRAELRQKAKVQVLLPPHRVPVSADDDPRLGPAAAPVTLVEFTDLQCPFCSRAQATVAALHQRYGDRLAIVSRDFPLAMHENAHLAAEAAGCAQEQGRYWEYRARLFSHQQQLRRDDLVDHAAAVGLDRKAFQACLSSGRRTAEVDHDVDDATALGLSGVPAFFVNGRYLAGAQPEDAFVRLIEEELGNGAAGK